MRGSRRGALPSNALQLVQRPRLLSEPYTVDHRGYATDAEAEDYLRIGCGQLQKHRRFGTRPNVVRIGRNVRTSYAELHRWVAAARDGKAPDGAASPLAPGA